MKEGSAGIAIYPCQEPAPTSSSLSLVYPRGGVGLSLAGRHWKVTGCGKTVAELRMGDWFVGGVREWVGAIELYRVQADSLALC